MHALSCTHCVCTLVLFLNSCLSLPRPLPQAVVLEELAALKGAMAAEREERVAEDDEVRSIHRVWPHWV